MNTKKANWLFFIMVASHIVLALLLRFTPLAELIGFNMAISLILSEMVAWLPSVIFLVVTKTNPLDLCRIKKVKITTLLMCILFTMLCSPIITLANAISLLFVENTVLNISGAVLQISFLPMFFLMAIYGPFVEEFVFRGVLYQSYKKQRNLWKAMLSADEAAKPANASGISTPSAENNIMFTYTSA